MKRIFFGIYLSIFTLSLSALPSTKPITDYLVQGYGTQPLAKDQREFVESIMQEMGIRKPIDMRMANWRAKAIWGRNNAIAIYDRYLFISDSFFDELTKEEQRFLIGHELSHIKFYHNSKQLSIWILLLILVFFLYGKINKILRPPISRRIIRIPVGLFCLWMLLIGRQMISATLSRVCERQADMESVRCLDCPKGGIKFIERLEQVNHIVPRKNQFQKVMAPWIATHPSNQERIDYLNDYKTNKDSK